MARLGIDFGTTNTVVVCSDRGRYPVVPHVAATAIGQVVREVFPSLLAFERDSGRMLYGLDAERALARPGAATRYGAIRSLKRLLREYTGGGRLGFEVRPEGFDTVQVLTGFARALRSSVLESGLFRSGEPLEAVITWPANANGAQRYVTRSCFRQAGFAIVATLNEPAAAAIEFADRIARGNRTAARQLRASVVVFDFGGGTFDASLLRINGSEFTVIDSAGIEELGGDDLDAVLGRMFLRRLRIEPEVLSPLQRDLLRQHACQQKESIAGGTVRTLTLIPSDIGLEGKPCTVPVTSYFRELERVLAPAIETVWTLVNGRAASAAGIAPERLDALYLVGGSSKLPLVAELLAQRFPGIKLVMTDKPFTATAMGAAIHSAEAITMHDILARHFGVLRLADHGQREYFAPIFHAGVRLPARGMPPVESRIEYTPRHNIGHLRYFECAAVDPAGRPAVGVRQWSDVLFPYDPAIPVERKVAPEEIEDRDDLADSPVAEVYSCDSDGVISVRVSRRRDGQSRAYEIFRS